MSNYGIPYMGSKSKIVLEIIRRLPKAENFYDLFGGGFSITHAMLKHRYKDFKQFHFNELREGVVTLIKDSIAGKYSYDVFKPKWISREEFFEKKENDAYIKIIWSFGNRGGSYMFGKDIEEDKRSLHQAIVFNEFNDFAKEIFGIDGFKEGYSINEKRLYLKNRLKLLKKQEGISHLSNLERIERLQQLEQLQQLERLQLLQRLPKPEFYSGSYEKIVIKQNSVIYCDPPYANTADYESSFNTPKFLDWAADNSHPVFISEYEVSDKRFYKVFEIDKRSMLSATKDVTLVKKERLYANRAAYKLILKR